METLVSKTLLEKVGPDGKTDSYYSKDRTWLEYLCQDAIKTATVAAVREAAEKLGPDLKRLVSAELVKRKEDLAAQLVDGLINETESFPWMVKAQVTLQKKEKR
jgi:hypothetical protein